MQRDIAHHVLTVMQGSEAFKSSGFDPGATCYAIYLIHYDQIHLSFAQN